MRDIGPASNRPNDQQHVLLQKLLEGGTVAIELLAKSAERPDYF